ncbi:MAG TPA: PaaI family thioesterase [Acidobacteriaceae bacterium]|nr:PaaI family thioesterase [Acidobacteriaceae bacterium]
MTTRLSGQSSGLPSALTPLAHGALNRCFGCGLENPSGLRLRFFIDADLNIVCRLRLAGRFAGPPGHAHGGIIATLLDEAMSKANRARGIVAMTRALDVQYLRPVPLGQPLVLTARHVSTTGRRHHIEGALRDTFGHALATATAVFVTVPPDLLHRLQSAAVDKETQRGRTATLRRPR